MSILSFTVYRALKSFAGVRWSGPILVSALVLAPAAVPAAPTTIVFKGSFVDKVSPTTTKTYEYEAGIQTPVNNFGNVLNYSGTVPASSQAGWRDPQGATIQGDGRYASPARSNGPFVLSATYMSASNHLMITPVGTVFFSNGAAIGAWLGKDANGIVANTGVWAGRKLRQLDQQRLARTGDPVQVGTGAMLGERTLFELRGARDWSFQLTYNSVLASTQDAPGAVGYGWTHRYEARIVTSGTDRIVQWGGGRANTFAVSAADPQVYRSTEDGARYDTLASQPGGGWMLTRRDQSALVFNANGRLVEDRDPHGRKLVLAYDGSSRLASITESVSGAALVLAYVFGTQRIESVSDPSGAAVSFGYTFDQLLNRITNQNGKKTTFAYNPDRALLTVAGDDGAVLTSNTFDSTGRTVGQEDGVTGNQPITFAYTESGLPGNSLYAAADAAKVVPLPLPVPGEIKFSSFTGLDGRTINYSYDAADYLLSATVAGQTTKVDYDDRGKVVSVTDPAGVVTAIDSTVCVDVNDRTGSKTTYRFDADFNLLSFTDGAGQTTTYAYDAMFNLVSITDPLDRTSRFTYDSAGNRLTATDPASGTTTCTYDLRNNLLSTTDAGGNVTRRVYDERNNLVAQTDAAGGTTTWTYDANSLPLTKVLPGGGVFRYDYSSGRLVQVIDPSGVATRFGYDANGRTLFWEDAMGKRTNYRYDAVGNLLSVTSATNQTWTFLYDYRNRIQSRTDPMDAVTRYAYDNNNNLVTETDALGRVTTYTYDGEDRLRQATDAHQHAVVRAYDPAGRITSVTDPVGGVFRFAYDPAGQLTATTDPLGGRAAAEYDATGAQVRAVDVMGRAMAFEHDALGRCVNIRNPLGRVTTCAWDPLDRARQVQDPGGLAAVQRFDLDGNLIALTNPAGNTTTLDYDQACRLVAVHTPEGRSTRYQYDGRGFLAEVTSPSGRSRTYAYDDAGQLSALHDGMGAVAYTRDAAGRVVTVAAGEKTIGRTYDVLGHLLSYTDEAGNSIGYAYDELGRLTRLRYPDGKMVDYDYDTSGRLVRVTDWAGRITSFVYDALGNQTLLTRPNGTRQQRSYDAGGDLIQLMETGPGPGEVICSGNFQYDDEGNLIGETVTPGVESTVDPLQQTFDRDNRLETHNGFPVATDLDGNLLSVGTGGGMVSYTYDLRGRLSTAGTNRYGYDAEGRLVTVSDGRGETRAVINPNARLDQVLVRTAPNGDQTYYVYAGGLLYEEGSGGVRYYHCDRRGDTVALTDDSGRVTDRATYGPYGEVVVRSGTSVTPFMFGGYWGVQTDASGLCFHRARFYSPVLRRFLTEDTVLGCIERHGTLNRYAYTNGNPVTHIDPSGDYDRDVHHDLTRSLAIRAGFSVSAAEVIAAADQGTDDDPRTGPYGTERARRDFHFTTPLRREQMLRAATEDRDLEKFGRYLHAEQDSYAHQRGEKDRDGEPYRPDIGHAQDGPAVDKTHLRPELAVKMAESTYRQLRQFHEVISGKRRCDDWDNIRPVVEHWVRIEKTN